MDWTNSWEDDDEWSDDEYVESDEDDGESETIECPECGTEVYEDAELCPTCGNYIVHTSSGYVWRNRPAWWIVLGFVGILAVIWALLPIF